MTALRPSLCALLTLLGGSLQAQALPPSEDLTRRLEALSREINQVKGELATLKAAPQSPSDTVVGGYGEIVFNHFSRNAAQDTADLRRLVLGVTHRFDARTKLVTELEVEHAVTSADDAGEVAVEQAYIEHAFSDVWGLRAGLFTMPLGLLNESHEPTAFYGVDRNRVETAIIPSTWREGGVQVLAAFQSGLTVQGGVSTGFDLSKWDAAAPDGRESPLAASHQELSFAKSRHLALFGAVNYRGLPGLLVGASGFAGKGGQGQPGVPAMGVTLWEAHARWNPGALDCTVLFAQGAIQDTKAFNTPLVGNPTLVPKRFRGFYAMAAYRFPLGGALSLAPFARFENVNTALAYEDLGPGLTPAAAKDEKIWTAGVNFNLNAHVVVKADLRNHAVDSSQNRVSLGLGWSF